MMAPERPCPEDEVGVAAMRGAVSIADLPVFALHGGQLRELKEGDGAMVEVAALNDDQADKPAGEDNDLTSLSWLHDKNLLKEMNLKQPGSQESPTSDFADETGSEPADSTCSSGPSPPTPPPPAPQRHKHPTHMPYDPQVHTSSKPPYSFSCLIFMAIEDSAARALPVKDIYTWVLEHFPYFKSAPTGWKNSVRHNLSLNKCFRKVEKAPQAEKETKKEGEQLTGDNKMVSLGLENLGKGSLWMVDPTYRPNLLQALQKAPFHPYTTLDRINMVTSRHPGGNGGGSVGGRTEGRTATGRMPDPELFPFLARRLAASARPASPPRPPRRGSDSSGADMDDDVYAATAIMQLKHGSRMASLSRRGCADSWLSRRKPRTARSPSALAAPAGALGPVVTTSPSEDHTYSAAGNIVAPGSVLGAASHSPDEAFADGSDSDSWVHRRRARYPSHSDSEEQRKIAEGADALLNLAGIATARRYPDCPPRPVWPGESSPPAPSAPASPPRRPRKRPAPSPPPPAPAFRPRILRGSRKRHGRKRKPINNNNNTVLNGNVRPKKAERDWIRGTRHEEKKKSRR